MLAGFNDETDGDASIFGYSIKENITSIQQIMGICPQFDILVRNFLRTFSILSFHKKFSN